MEQIVASSATDHGENVEVIQLYTRIVDLWPYATDHGELVEFSLRCRLWCGATFYGEIMEVCSWNVVRTAGDFLSYRRLTAVSRRWLGVALTLGVSLLSVRLLGLVCVI